MRVKLLLLLVLLAGPAHAQYTGALGSTWNNAGSALISQMLLNDMNRKALEKQLQNSDGTTTTKPATQPAFKYPLSRTDFTFKGQPSAQGQCASISDDPATQKQLADVCLAIYQQIEAQPDFRRHNLATGLTLLLGASWQVSENQEFTDAQFETMQRTLNDQMVTGGAMQKLSARDVQNFYETSVMIGGLLLALNEDENPDSRALGRELAVTVLKTFGLKK